MGGKIDRLHELREQKRRLEEEIKDLNSQMGDLENMLMLEMQQQGVTKLTGMMATVSVNESVKPQVEDWDAFMDYLTANRLYHLVDRRPSSTGCRELFEKQGQIPGIVPFTLRKLSCRSL
jgi:hypothetical protein